MLKRSVGFLAAPVFALALVMAASAQETPLHDIPDGYLTGTWAVGGSEACGAETTEYITVNADGTFSAVQGNKPTAVGFWRLVDDNLDLHMVSSPAFFADELQPLAGQYTYYYAKALLFDIEERSFRMVAYLAGQLRGANLGRCP
jgi:hypothetical protein